ncbi:MAG: fasciclin domain-containing protein [Gemmatimonadaceae bacterium]
MTKSRMAVAALALALSAPAVVSAQYGMDSSKGKAPAKDIVAVASEAGSFKTLVAAVKAAGLVETLQGEGPFTVFAPTDAAFAKLPKGTVEALLADKAKLAAILTYHVVPGKLMAADVIKMGGGTPATVNGQPLTVKVTDGKVYVNDATVTKADIAASNGVIHAIDTVVIPK